MESILPLSRFYSFIMQTSENIIITIKKAKKYSMKSSDLSLPYTSNAAWYNTKDKL